MAKTNFAALDDVQKTVWARDVWKVARNSSFLTQFMGTSHNSMIHRITELTKDERGTNAIYTLVPDLEGDGITGDNDLEGNEEAMVSYQGQINLDQLRNANRTTGRLADQKTIVNFREQSKNLLGYWLGDRIDQLAFLTMSGLAYTNKNNGGTRKVNPTGGNLSDLEFAADVKAPSSERHLRVAGSSLDSGDTSALTASDKFGYRQIVEACAYAKENYVKGVRGSNGSETYHFFLTPQGMAQLKLDSDFLANVRNAGVRGSGNSLFKGGESFEIDGAMIHSFRHVYSNQNAGTKWGSGGDVTGQRILMCGAQSLCFADIGNPYWDERNHFDYGNQKGISVGKMFGMVKPQFVTPYTQETDVNGDKVKQDFGVIAIDAAL